MKLYHRDFENDTDLLRASPSLMALAARLGGSASPCYSHGHGPAYLVTALPDGVDASEFGTDVTNQFDAEQAAAEEELDEELEDDSWEDEDDVEDEEDGK